jgi:hypothetical protein
MLDSLSVACHDSSTKTPAPQHNFRPTKVDQPVQQDRVDGRAVLDAAHDAHDGFVKAGRAYPSRQVQNPPKDR